MNIRYPIYEGVYRILTLYIGKNIRLYYQTPGCKDEPVCAFVADFQKDDMNGSAICDLLLYENFSPEKMNGFVMDAIHG